MELISQSKGWTGSIDFDVQVPELGDDANIQDALKMFFFGEISSGNVYDYTNSLYHHLVSLKSLVDSASSNLNSHSSASSDAHGIGSGASVVGTTTSQTLSNKTLTSPVINSPSFNSGGLAPVGSIMQYAGSSAPTGWVLCDGTAIGRVTYSALFSVLSTTYGAGDGSTTFNVPNIKGKVVVGLDSSQVEFDALNETGGAKTHTHESSADTGTSGDHYHTTADHSHGIAHTHNVGNHDHTTNDHSHSINPGTTSTTSDSHSHSANSGAVDSGNASVATGTGVSMASPNHVHGFTTGSDTHSHTVNIAAFNSAGANAGNTTSADGAAGTSAVYRTNAYSNNSDGASDGNTTSSPNTQHSHTIPATASDSSLQPYIVLNYIIKY